MKKEEKGFTLVEVLISTTLLIIVMYSVFMMIEFQMEFSRTQQAKTRLQQESRYLLSSFAADLKNAGAILTLTHTGGFLANAPYFNGIFPINGVDAGTADDYPDGIIVASADPDATTTLSQAFTPSAGGTIPVTRTLVTDSLSGSTYQPWLAEDMGIIVGINGYYIFRVATIGTDNLSITMGENAVYYSGLLNSNSASSGTTTGYVDTPASFGTGDTLNYPQNAPVMRLTNFGIYLVDERFDYKQKRNVRELIKITDANGDTSGNFLTSGSSCIKGVIAENIWDFQISYFCYPNYPDHTVINEYFSAGSSGTFADLLAEIRSRSLKEIVVNVVALSDTHAGKGTFSNQVPSLGDAAGYTLPTGKYNYQIFNLSIDPRNYNISL
jgi:type II secretory pathway pseudopilin PulG